MTQFVAKDTTNLFSFSGGGAKGLWMCEFLHHFFNAWGINHNEFYKYASAVTGTSVGALIAAGLLIGKSPAQMKTIFLQHLPMIFTVNPDVESSRYGWVDKLALMTSGTPLYITNKDKNPAKGEYGHKRLYDVIDLIFSDIRLKDLPIPFACIGANQTDNHSVIFSSINAPQFHDNNIKLADVLKITTAAPVFFPSYSLLNSANEQKIYIDGGVASNNPTDLCETISDMVYSNRRTKLICNITSGREYLVDNFSSSDSNELLRGAEDGLSGVINLIGETIGYTEDLQIKLNKIDTLYSNNSRYMYICYPYIDKTLGSIDMTSPTSVEYYADLALDTFNNDALEISAFIQRLSL